MYAVSPRSRTARLVGLLCGVAVLLVGCTPERSPEQVSGTPSPRPAEPGAAGAGDEYYPKDGNGGYDALDYAISLRYDPAEQGIEAEATVTTKATKRLGSFNLDLRGLRIESVSVNGKPAEFKRAGEFELVITPAEPLPRGQKFRTHVVYHGTPQRGSGGLGANGWNRESSGAMYVLGEPHSASFWYPVNGTPKDKATFHLEATVPREWSAISIGRLTDKTTEDGWTTWHWDETTPVAPYLTTLAVDKFSIERGELADGTPVLNAYAPGAGDMRSKGSRAGEVIAFLATKFGPYPQRAAGGIYLDTQVGFSLETQGRPTYTNGVGIQVIVHELAHQWYGNSVTVRSWADICLNECFASYATWLWAAHEKGLDLDARYRSAIERFRGDKEFWAGKLYDMGPGNEFTAVYSKGLLAIHALRNRIGEEAFAEVLREWPARHKNGHASWPQFERFVMDLTGKDLKTFFDAWFHSRGIPQDQYLFPGDLGG